MRTCKGTKKMQGCGETKPLTDFYQTKRWRNHTCIECFNKYKREKRAETKTIEQIANMAWN